MKTCTTCNLEKLENEFASAGGGKKRAKCKKCLALQKQQYYKDNPDKAKHRNLKTFYGIDYKQFSEMVLLQNGLCSICKKSDRLCVDHCHKTGKVRGLLCNNCNFGIGQFQDNVSVLEGAISYLQSHNTPLPQP